MAELAVLAYRPGSSYLHKMDIRCKLLVLLLLNGLLLNTVPVFLGWISICLVALFIWQRIPLLATLKQTRFFFILIFLVLLTRTVFTPGDPLISYGTISISSQGLVSGLIYCWRMTLVLIAGILFISTTRTVEIKAGIQWFLKPVPLVPEKRVAVMISLMIRFLPLVLEQSREISEAQKSRGAERIKNPVKKLYVFSIPLLRRIFETADKLVLAMEARSYSEHRTDPELILKFTDIVVVLSVALFSVIVLTR